MAKPKRSVALFEVIRKDPRFDRHGGALPTPAWMNKGKSAPVAPIAPAATPPPISTQHIPPGEASPPIEQHVPEPAPGAIQANAGDSWPVVAPSDGFAPIAPGVSREASPFTQTSVAIIAAAAVLVLGLGIYLSRSGQHLSPAQTVLQGPPHPEVLDVGSSKPLPHVESAPMPQPAAAVMSPTRQAGLNYVVIHLYVTQKSAVQMNDYLNKHNIPCTVERNLPGIAPQFYAVVSLKAFSRPGAPEYAAYVQQIKSMLGTMLTAKSFRPQLIKWTAAGETAQAN